MGQVNVNYDDLVLKGIDRVAASRQLSRPELFRIIAAETVEAHDAGRLAFQTQDGPRIDSSLNALAAQLRDAVVELDRVQRSTQRHEKKMFDAWVASEDTIRIAEEKLVGRINDINRKSYEPFVDQLKQLRATFGKVSDQLTSSQDTGLQKIDQRLEAVRAEATAPRNLYKVVFPGDFSIGFLTSLGAVIGLVGALVFLFAAANMGWLIANATKASDGKWHAVRNDQLYRGQHLLGAIHSPVGVAGPCWRVTAFSERLRVPRLVAQARRHLAAGPAPWLAG